MEQGSHLQTPVEPEQKEGQAIGTMGAYVLWETRNSVEYPSKPSLMDGEENTTSTLILGGCEME